MKAMILLSALLSAPTFAHALPDLLQGTFTNGEQVYFDKEAGRETSAWYGMRIADAENGLFTMQVVNAFGEELGDPTQLTLGTNGGHATIEALGCTRTMRAEGDGFVLASSEGSCASLPSILTSVTPSALTFELPDGNMMEVRRANHFSCWAAVKTSGTDGARAEWTFDNDLQIHDQGGRVSVAGGDSGAPETILRMRNVVWPAPSRNRPSLVLYIHTADEPESAVSYSWADPEATRIGINLRWMQGSCSRNDDTASTASTGD